MPVDIASAVSAVVPTPTDSSTPYGAPNADQVRKADEARAQQLAEQRRLEEIQADQQRADTARQQRDERAQISRNSDGEMIGTIVSTSA
ncbi:hypothetical protein [Herbaspirillum sp. YR522]|uniref:hypothetical protein n=1 Tax=Herbaspirillum sp. YR522 TaxID=1144342 RepID=UPI00026FC470|nr:hypothetical protein [Herbaspirillum sp. YR522]EJN09601.1 hypothetical protein PMI40_00609 [Herbaspirillum sp. YR522]